MLGDTFREAAVLFLVFIPRLGAWTRRGSIVSLAITDYGDSGSGRYRQRIPRMVRYGFGASPVSRVKHVTVLHAICDCLSDAAVGGYRSGDFRIHRGPPNRTTRPRGAPGPRSHQGGARKTASRSTYRCPVVTFCLRFENPQCCDSRERMPAVARFLSATGVPSLLCSFLRGGREILDARPPSAGVPPMASLHQPGGEQFRLPGGKTIAYNNSTG